MIVRRTRTSPRRVAGGHLHCQIADSAPLVSCGLGRRAWAHITRYEFRSGDLQAFVNGHSGAWSDDAATGPVTSPVAADRRLVGALVCSWAGRWPVSGAAVSRCARGVPPGLARDLADPLV